MSIWSHLPPMALLDYVTREEATGAAAAFYAARSDQYAALRDEKGRSLYTELRLNNPAVVEAQQAYRRALLDSGAVDESLFEIVMVAVAQANDCDYCAGSHLENLDLLLGLDDETVSAVGDGDFAALPARERAVAEFATACIEDPHRLDADDLDRLRAIGFDDADVIQLLAVAGYCDTANLLVNALNAHPADLERSFRY
jgi:uncharacterized peroxidase-related enzyme